MTGRRTTQVLLMLGGLIAWVLQFTLIYGVTSTLCGRGWADETLLNMGIVQITVLAVTAVSFSATAILLLVTVHSYRQQSRPSATATDSFMIQAGLLINGLSLIVILWHGLPAFILPACA